MNTSSDRGPSPSYAPVVLAQSERHEVHDLSPAECWRLVETSSLGRLAVQGADGAPDVFPLNYTVHEESLYIRTAVGSKLAAIAAHPVVAFEVDGEADGHAWSVVLRGPASRLALDKEIRESGVRALVSANPTGKYNFIRVTPSSISGRRFEITTADSVGDRSILRRAPNAPEPARRDPDDAAALAGGPHAYSPVPIAHLPPL